MQTSFNSKETYLAYRSEWKATYKQLSIDIREQKAYIRSQHTPSYSDYGTLYSMKAQAREMLETLKMAKEEAQRQYLAAKTNVLIAA